MHCDRESLVNWARQGRTQLSSRGSSDQSGSSDDTQGINKQESKEWKRAVGTT